MGLPATAPTAILLMETSTGIAFGDRGDGPVVFKTSDEERRPARHRSGR